LFVFCSSFNNCIVWPSIHGFWLTLWYLQTFLSLEYYSITNNQLVVYDIHSITFNTIIMEEPLWSLSYVVAFTIPMQSVPITTKVVSSNHAQGEVHSIQHCDKVCQWLAAGWWFSLETPASSTNKTDRHDIAEKLLKVVLNVITLILSA